jgi:EAL domain-containing protein (putative c-di-GMP-specific phosphodiesterase class I)
LRRESEDAAIIRAVVGLGQALGLAVVAEGVETAEESAQVSALGCTQGQGYYWARPLSPEQADLFVHRCRERG